VTGGEEGRGASKRRGREVKTDCMIDYVIFQTSTSNDLHDIRLHPVIDESENSGRRRIPRIVLVSVYPCSRTLRLNNAMPHNAVKAIVILLHKKD